MFLCLVFCSQEYDIAVRRYWKKASSGDFRGFKLGEYVSYIQSDIFTRIERECPFSTASGGGGAHAATIANGVPSPPSFEFVRMLFCFSTLQCSKTLVLAVASSTSNATIAARWDTSLRSVMLVPIKIGLLLRLRSRSRRSLKFGNLLRQQREALVVIGLVVRRLTSLR